MKIPKIAEAMGEIDADLVSASAKERRRAKQPWIKWSVLTAACLCVVILAGAIALPMMLDDDALPEGYYVTGKVISFGDMKRHYKYTSVTGSESATLWPNEYKTVSERYSNILWNFQSYDCSGVTLGVDKLGDKLGNYLGFGVRKIKGISEQDMIAVGLDGNWYVYRCRDRLLEIPQTLGELLDRYSLSETLELDRFTEHQGRGETYYSLTDDEYIIEVLASCRDAKQVDSSQWERGDEYLSFTVTSDALGVYKKAMYITKDGYLKTNAFDFAYVYEIGQEAAQSIYAYALENSTEKETFEPYEYTLAGTVTEIRDGFVYIDDSVMCVKPSEGVVFRVSMEDIRVRRCIEHEGVGVGDLVVVTFRGGIAIEDGNLILDARSINRAYISDGDWYVPE